MALVQEIPEALIRSAQAGDPAAVSRLLAQLRPHAYRWALVQTQSPDDAEDIVQDALLRAVRGLRFFAHESRITTWLHTIVRSTAADWRRTRRRRAALLVQQQVRTTVEPEQAANQELIDAVRAGIGMLSGRQREVFDLVDLKGMAPGEAAGLLGMNAATVRVHLLRARRRMRSHLLDRHAHAVEDRT
jgi:RNA polymerase sigma-70 factor, ECF subfamily